MSDVWQAPISRKSEQGLFSVRCICETGKAMITQNPRRQDIYDDLADLEDIPGTRVFTTVRARQGYWLNQFAMTLMKHENRIRFKTDERAYLDEWPMSEAQKQAVLARDYNAAIDEGGNIYFLAKIIFTDGISFLEAVGTMTGMSAEDYQAMMIAGGRSPAGVRSKKDPY